MSDAATTGPAQPCRRVPALKVAISSYVPLNIEQAETEYEADFDESWVDDHAISSKSV
jgi:hypothetical protein